MDRITFIKSLAAELAYKTKPSEIHHLIDYYDEMIQDLMEEGLSEVMPITLVLNGRHQITIKPLSINNRTVNSKLPHRGNPRKIITNKNG